MPAMQGWSQEILGHNLSLFFAEDAHQFRGGVRETGAAPRDQVDVAGHTHLADLHFFHPAVLDLPLHAHSRDDGYAHAHLDEALDAFDGGHFDGHVQRGAMAGEELDDPAAEGGLNDVADKCFAAQVSDIYFFSLG